MRTHVLQAHVTRHGGKLVPPGDGSNCDFLCCDKGTRDEKIKELWGSEASEKLLALHNTFISQSVVAGRRLPYGDFLRMGQAPASEAVPPAPSPSSLGKRAASQTDSTEHKNKVAAIFLQQPKGPPMHHAKDKGYVSWWSSDFTPKSSVAAFDMDHTILRPMGMYVYIYMSLRMYVYIHIFFIPLTYIYVNGYVYIPKHITGYVVYIYMLLRMYVYKYIMYTYIYPLLVCMYTCIYVAGYVCVYIYVTGYVCKHMFFIPLTSA